MTRKPQGRPQPGKSTSNKPQNNGPVYLPKHIYALISEEAKNELDKYNKEKRTNYQPNKSRMAKVHGQDLGKVEPPETPEPDLDNYYVEDSYPMQDSDTEELIESHSNYSEKMAFTYHISTFSFFLWASRRQGS